MKERIYQCRNMYAIFAAMFMTQLKAIQITASHQAPLLLISQTIGAAHSAALAKATSLQKRKQVIMTKGSAICRAFLCLGVCDKV